VHEKQGGGLGQTSLQAHLQPRLAPEVSRSIRMARVICITLMMTVHVWPGANKVIAAEVDPALHWFYVVLIREFGQASVPLLSIVSGLLFVQTVRPRKWAELVQSKTRTLLVPMVIWSVLLLLMHITKAIATNEREFFDASAMEWINRVFAITGPPINIPLAFLRDIFVCCMIGFWAFRLERYRPWVGRAGLLAIAALELQSEGILLLRPQILLFFGLGFFVAMAPPRAVELPWSLVCFAVATDIAVQASFSGQSIDWRDQINVFHRLAVAMLMWRIATSIARSQSRFGRTLERLEPTIFLVFCSHMLTISIMAAVFNGLGIQVTSRIYPLVFAVQIPVILGVGMLLDSLGKAQSPRLLALVSARR
jgi:fucose 4-O-acetylase-like acetyltransferase